MAVTFTENGTNTPNGVHKEFTYTFTTLRTDGTDVKVSLDGHEQATNKYTVDDTGSPTKITFNDTDPTAGLQVTTAGSDKGAPLTGVTVRVYRETLLEGGRIVDNLFSGNLPYNQNDNPYNYYYHYHSKCFHSNYLHHNYK